MTRTKPTPRRSLPHRYGSQEPVLITRMTSLGVSSWLNSYMGVGVLAFQQCLFLFFRGSSIFLATPTSMCTLSGWLGMKRGWPEVR